MIWLEDSPQNASRWVKTSGPGTVTFDNATSPVTTATFSAPGDYVLTLTASGSDDRSHSIAVHVEADPPKDRLDVVYTRKYSIDSPFWNQRAKTLIVDWIPHCIRMCERTDIPAMRGDGGIDNFIEAGKANRGEPHGKHKGYVFSNAWVHQTVESMCIALMVDPQGDQEIVQAQELMRATLERWIPIILAAQMPDGYLQTAYMLADRATWPERWSPDHRGNHEGYVSGYFIESAINHYTLTDGKDLRLYNAAKKLADCWVAQHRPGQEGLVRRPPGDGAGAGALRALCERPGRESSRRRLYRACEVPARLARAADRSTTRAICRRASSTKLSAMRCARRISIRAWRTSPPRPTTRDYQSAVISLWDNMVNKKYYLTGGIGSGETSEGFGPNYSLRNEAYCETCSSCGLVFFQYKLNLAYHDAKYADLYEQTMYNALLGGVALDGKSYCYTNPLINTERALWHVCPCCVGNLSRTLLMIPTWTYVKDSTRSLRQHVCRQPDPRGPGCRHRSRGRPEDGLSLEGSVSITVNPEQAKTFSVYVRIPDRTTSKLYHGFSGRSAG